MTTTPQSDGRPAAELTHSTDRTRSAVEEFLRRAATGDGERIAELYAEQVDWQVAPNPVVPWIKPRSTREDVVGHWRDLAAHTDPAQASFTVEALIVEGPDAVLTGELAGVVRSTGKRYEGPYSLRLTVTDRLITRHHICENSLSVAEACTP